MQLRAHFCPRLGACSCLFHEVVSGNANDERAPKRSVNAHKFVDLYLQVKLGVGDCGNWFIVEASVVPHQSAGVNTSLSASPHAVVPEHPIRLVPGSSLRGCLEHGDLSLGRAAGNALP